MIAPLRHTRILASAGSGKTFRLSARYIELLRREPDADPAGILASTFTRAAAAEIRDRVLLRLARAVLDPAARADLAVGTSLPPPDVVEAMSLLRRAARRIDRLRIRTLDSFFASAVSAFSVELGLPAEPSIPDDAELARFEEDAIEGMLSNGDEERLLASVAALRRGQPILSIGRTIIAAITGALQLAQDSPREAWMWDAPHAPGPEVVASLVDALARVEVPTSSDKRLRGALDAVVAGLHEIAPDDVAAWSKLLEGGVFVAVDRASYYGKPLPDELCRAVEDLRSYAKSLAWREAARRTRATRDLAEAYLAAFAEAKRAAGVVTFDDLARILGDAALRPDLTELALRLDAAVRHVLLDEFQDTSVLQWRALLPILRELAAGDPDERSIFLVGDLKQSIYGWRGASPALLERAPSLLLEEGELAMEDEILSTSYRSSPLVLEVIDRVFGAIETSPCIAEGPPRAAARAWRAAYRPHVAATPSLPGVVELHVAPTVDGPGGRRSAVLETASDVVGDLLADAARDGSAPRIGVLCRTNKAVAEILHRLRLRGLPADAAGAGSLEDAAPVNALIDVLVLADHPDDTIAAFHVARSPLGPVVGLPRDAHRDSAGRARISAALRDELDRRGYAQTLRRLRDAILPEVDRREAERLDRLVAGAVRFDRAPSTRPALRPARVAASLRALPVDERGAAATTVMNIHQSKGLEFDVVVLCDIDSAFRSHAPLVAARPGPERPYDRVLRWIPEAVRPPELEGLHASAIAERFREHLSLLYVALTRAKRGLFAVVGPPPKGGKSSSSFASILRQAWAPGVLPPAGETRLAIAGSRTALQGLRSSEAQGARAAPESPRLAVASGRRVERLTSASRIAGSGGGDPLARARGLALHAMLELVGWLDDGLPSVADLVSAGRAAARLDEATLLAIAGRLPAQFAAPEIREVLSRPATGAPPTLRREYRFARLHRTAEGTRLEEGAIDRLHLVGPPDRPTAALVVDYKSDRHLDPSAARERYGPQIEAYRAAVAERCSLDPAAVGAVVLLLESGRAVRWPVGG